MNAQTLTQILAIQIGYTSYVFGANLKGLSEEDGFKQPAPGGMASKTTRNRASYVLSRE